MTQDTEGRSGDVGSRGADGYDDEIGAPSSHRRRDDLNVTGDGAAVRDADPDVPSDDPGADADRMGVREGTPEDLRAGRGGAADDPGGPVGDDWPKP